MDLLSAALNESGVTEEFEEFDTSGNFIRHIRFVNFPLLL